MARLARLSKDQNGDREVRATSNAVPRGQRRVSLESLSPSPAASFSSDKENRQAETETSRQSKGKARAMEPPYLPTPETDAPRSNKRRKLSEREAPNTTQTTHAKQLADVADTDYYDPEQSIVERRAVRKDFRDLSKELTGE